MEFLTMLMLVLFCLVMEGFYSGTEIALISVSRHRLGHLIEQGDRSAVMLEQMFKSPSGLYGTTSAGTNIFVASGVTIMTVYLTDVTPDADLWATVVMAPVTLLFGEIFPKAFFQLWAEKIVYYAVYPLKASQKLFAPVLFITSGVSRMALRLVGAEEAHDLRAVTYDEIRTLFKRGEQKFDLHPDEQKMIHRIFSFKDIAVEECMIPLVNIAAVEKHEPMSSVRIRLHETGHSRMPVFNNRIYHITGIITAFEVLRYGEEAKVAADLARPAFYVYRKKKIDDLLKEMQGADVQMAVVVDEYSAAIGIVTREDLVEEIFGEIEDEYDNGKGTPEVVREGQNAWVLDASVEVDYLNDKYGWNLHPLADDDYETLAGYLLTHLENIPAVGERAVVGDFVYTVLEATEMGIRKVRVTRKKGEGEKNE